MLSFVGAVLLLGEQPSALSGLGLVLIVGGILLVAGLTREPHRAPRKDAAPTAVVSVLGPIGYILVLFAMRIAPISHIAPARELATLAGAYMGSRLLSERTTPERIIGAVCIVVGVVSLSFAR